MPFYNGTTIIASYN